MSRNLYALLHEKEGIMIAERIKFATDFKEDYPE